MLQRLLGMITLLISTHSIAAPVHNKLEGPEGYNAICSYGNTCMLTKANLVAFGSQGQYVYKVLSGSFACNEKTFNRPAIDSASATCAVKTKQSTAITKASPNKALPQGLNDGIYAIVSRHSGKALALNDNNTLRQTPYSDAHNTINSQQYFELKKGSDGYYTLKAFNKQGANYLTVKDWQTGDGTGFVLDEASNSWNQEWQLSATSDGFYTVVSRFNNKALDLLGLNTHNNAKLQLWTYWGGNNQQWQLIPIQGHQALKGNLEF